MAVCAIEGKALKKKFRKKWARFINGKICSRLRALRETLHGIAGYLVQKRAVAAAVARFRIGYGPDLASLAKRGIWGAGTVLCRWCKKEVEDSDHLLFRCAELACGTSSLWGLSLSSVLGDGSKWERVGEILLWVYEKCKGV